MDKKIKIILATLAALAAIGAGAAGYAELPKKVKNVEDKQITLETSLVQFQAASTANIEAQKQLNVAQNNMFQQQMTQQMAFLEKMTDDYPDKRRSR